VNVVIDLAEKKRLTGVTVLAILNIIIGIGDITNIAPLVGIGGMIGVFWLELEAIAGLIEGILVLQGIVLFVLAYGFLGGKGWGWTLGLIFGIWDIVMGLILLPAGIIRIIYGAIIIYYLTRSHVKAFFGKH